MNQHFSTDKCEFYLTINLFYLVQAYEHKMEEMQNKMESEKKEKEQIQADMQTLREQYERDLASIDQQAKYVKSPGQQQLGI